MRVVIALGGNAILPRGARGEISEQRAAVREACEALAQLAADGHDLILTHGNGPQVGRMMLKNEAFPHLPALPLDVLVAESQAQIGYLIQQELLGALRRARVERDVVTILTQVLVDAADPAFLRPTKPVGPFVDAAEAAAFKARGIAVAEVPGGGWRRLVPSPAPLEIIEGNVVRALVDNHVVPIAAGGGGVPVVRDGNSLRGVAAVIDKDLSAAMLVRAVAADVLLILTDVEHVERAFGTKDAHPIERMTAAEARAGVDAGEFPHGTMAEKVLAGAIAAEFGARAVIGSLARALDALAGRSGTEIVP
jgi:carbamate kinase